MSESSPSDQFAIVQIAGLHSHLCEQALQKAFARLDGIREVEVDFASGLASVLFNPSRVSLQDLSRAVAEAGYQAGGITVGEAGCRGNS